MNKAYRYGIELELICPSEFYNRVEDAMQALKKVDVTGDGSIRDTGYNHSGMELRIGVLGFQGMERKISKVCKILNDNDCTVNNSCGFHLHMSNKRFQSHKYIKRIIHTWLAIEDVMVSLQPRSRLNNSYCLRLLARHIAGDSLENLPVKKSALIEKLGGINRYHTLNLASLALHGTIENRLHSATLDKNKIMSWVKLQRAFFDYCLTEYNPEVVNTLLKTPVSINKVDDVFKLFKLDEQLTSFYKTRLHEVLFSYLVQQNKEALKVIDAKKAKERLMKKIHKLSNDMAVFENQSATARRLFTSV
jgi:hypothetical protein